MYDDGDNVIVLSLSTGKGGARRRVERADEKSERANIYLLKVKTEYYYRGVDGMTTDVKIHNIIHI